MDTGRPDNAVPHSRAEQNTGFSTLRESLDSSGARFYTLESELQQ